MLSGGELFCHDILKDTVGLVVSRRFSDSMGSKRRLDGILVGFFPPFDRRDRTLSMVVLQRSPPLTR